MIEAIIYESNAGHTKKYAEILEEKTGIKAYTIKEAAKNVSKKSDVIFMSWVKNGKIQKLNNVRGKYNLKGICAVGMNGYSKQAVATLQDKNKINALKEKLFYMQGGFEMEKLNRKGGKVMFMGSSEKTLALDRKSAAEKYPNLEVVTYSPPYKPEFSDEDNKAIIDAINSANPDLLWIGMTAPKQEKWTYSHWDELNIHCHVGTIGAVFDFFAGTVKRAPEWWQRNGLEWLYRLIMEPKRMWRRYIIGNALFIKMMIYEKFK